MVKNRVIYGGLLLLLFWLKIMYNGWQTDFVLKAAVMIPLVIVLINVYAAMRVRVSFKGEEEYCQKGGHIRKCLMINNNSIVPLPRIEVVLEISDHTGNVKQQTIVVNAEKRSELLFALDMTFEHYGMAAIRIKSIRIFDFFFLCPIKRKQDNKTFFYVLPEYQETLQFQIRDKKDELENEECDENTLGRRGSNHNEIYEVDFYHEGDDIRNIHWKLSSKSEELIVKHFGETVDEKVNIYVDVRIPKDKRYMRCDRISALLRTAADACVSQGLAYEIYGYDGKEIFRTDVRDIYHHYVIGDRSQIPFAKIAESEYRGQRCLFLTTQEQDEKEMPQHLQYLVIPSDFAKWEEKRCVALENYALLRMDVSEDEEDEKQGASFVELHHDRSRQREIRKPSGNTCYVVFMSFVAFLGAAMAICSVYDVVYLQQENYRAMFAVGGFVLLHFMAGCFFKEGKRERRGGSGKNLVVLLGYLVILLLGKFSFLFDGTQAIVELFQGNMIVEGNDFGFLEYLDTDINWLLLLLSYAVVDVMYNFSVDFVSVVHLLIVLPLISISFIVGELPPLYVVLSGVLYFPVIFCLKNCFHKNHHYPITAKLAASVGIFTAGVSLVVMAFLSVILLVGGFHRMEWESNIKEHINAVLDTDRMRNVVENRREGKKGLRTAAEKGKLDDSKKIGYTGETVLEVQAYGLADTSFYLKSYAGTDYTGEAWIPRSDIKVFYNHLSYQLADFQIYGKYQIQSISMQAYRMQVVSLLNGDNNVYQPYCSVTDAEDGEISEKDGFEQRTDADAKKLTFYGYNLVAEDAYIPQKIQEDEKLERLLVREQSYAEYVEENYLEIPSGLKALMSGFSDVKTIYNGNEVELICGDKQYRTIGYEPYIQYVRRYFQDNSFAYDMNMYRKDDSGDFIQDFMKRRTGYCIHFASAGVMMFRSMGIPARYAQGYYVKEEDIAEQIESGYRYEVPDQAAHAWVEIYKEGIGWVPIEVTPGNENFVIVKETEKAEKITGESGERQTTEAAERTTTEVVQQTTARDDEKVSEQGTDVKMTHSGLDDHSQDGNRFMKMILLLLVFPTAVLLRYQSMHNRNEKRMRSKKRKLAMNEMERQMTAMLRIFSIELQNNVKKEDNAEKIAACIHGDKESIMRILRLSDKLHYAPEGSITEEDREIMLDFLGKLGRSLYQKGNIYEKFMYKYIKCLYLSNK